MANLVRNYFPERTLWCERPKEYIVTAGGSRLQAVDIFVPVKQPENVEVKATKKMSAVNIWLEKGGLTLADEKNGSGVNNEIKTQRRWKSVYNRYGRL